MPFFAERHSRELTALMASLAIASLIFWFDVKTPLGYAEWALYLVPVTMTVLQNRFWMPLAVALVVTGFSVAGFYASPPGIDITMAIVNRSVGAVVLWVLAGVISQVLSTRARMHALLWLDRGEAAVAQQLLGEQTLTEVAGNAARSLCEFVGAQTAVVYRLERGELQRTGGYAFDPASTAERIRVPDGTAGQVAQSGRPQVLRGVATSHLPVVSALGRSASRHVVAYPLRINNAVTGVIEIGFLGDEADLEQTLELLEKLSGSLGVAMRTSLYLERLETLLEETQRQGEALQAQQEELRVTNEELEEQSRVLRESQTRLETQQFETEQTNVRLEEQAQVLERQKLDLLVAQQALKDNADRLEAASRYKSEFLANMSHELRTPLNSSLILSKLLADNREGNLHEEQVKYARAIQESNNDLLVLINDILDLSKIEAGHVDLNIDPVPLRDVTDRLRSTFEPLARHKGLAFDIQVQPGVPEQMSTDSQRLQQVLKNLLANAVKFTERGEVRLVIRPAPGQRVAFEVTDSGMGIPRNQQDIIFEAFRQADGSTSRRFGGTGLGLSISRELAHRLGGEIRVDSEPGRGSTFTVELPVTLNTAVPAPIAPIAPAALVPAPVPHRSPVATSAPVAAPPAADPQRTARHPGRLILAVEDDPRFAAVLADLADELGFDCVIAPTGAEGLALAQELQPSGILLDVGLPDQSGLTVLERLKRDPATRHLPVHMMSAHERTQTALELGAVGFVLKPATREHLVDAINRLQERLQREMRRVLIVEDDVPLRNNLVLLLKGEHVGITAVGSIADALRHLEASTFDCMVMDLQLSDGSGYELLEKMAAGEQYAFPPVVVYTGRTLSRDEEQRLRRYSKSIIVKGARSPERLLDEVTLFLHSVESSLPPEQQRLLVQGRQRDAVLDGRRILLVEDDVRNIFALTSVFEPLGARLEIARNGREAIEKLEQVSAIDLVLMDIMMPEMDGMTAMRLIRERPHWATLPIIALTAKAMPEDRTHCLEAGANDYVAKPIDIDKLVSLCRVWMPK